MPSLIVVMIFLPALAAVALLLLDPGATAMRARAGRPAGHDWDILCLVGYLRLHSFIALPEVDYDPNAGTHSIRKWCCDTIVAPIWHKQERMVPR